jgi:hypothetical protein
LDDGCYELILQRSTHERPGSVNPAFWPAQQPRSLGVPWKSSGGEQRGPEALALRFRQTGEFRSRSRPMCS